MNEISIGTPSTGSHPVSSSGIVLSSCYEVLHESTVAPALASSRCRNGPGQSQVNPDSIDRGSA